eukprot:446821-Amorphochlora_amoeboformis.AAC.1
MLNSLRSGSPTDLDPLLGLRGKHTAIGAGSGTVGGRGWDFGSLGLNVSEEASAIFEETLRLLKRHAVVGLNLSNCAWDQISLNLLWPGTSYI